MADPETPAPAPAPAPAQDAEPFPERNLLERAQDEFPIIKNQNVVYKDSYGRDKSFLESWPPGENGTAEMPRPQEFGTDKFGVEIYNPKTTPLDVVGDIVSHKMVHDDPEIKKTYDDFAGSLKPWQKNILKAQYEHAKNEYGEARPYGEWEEASGMPAYFRGHPFKQWKDADELYTPGQMKKLDQMMDYLRGKGKAKSRRETLYGSQDTEENN